jgi:AcrR family transcriptional regulator
VADTRSRAERKEQTRRKLLDVTLRLITERSLAGISLREVAREAGIVPTAFYRHYASVDELGVDLVDESMRPLRQMLRDTRKGRVVSSDIIADTVRVLAIATELRLFTSDLTVDLARLTAGFDWSTDDLEMAADLMVGAMLGTVIGLLETDVRHPEDAAAILNHGERQLRLIVLGMASWRSKP